jgi:NADH-quinone oxidoreductase subunit G
MSEEQINVTINGREYPAQRGQMLIEVADAHDIDIPRFCYHKHLSVAANCRMCMVEVEKAPKPLPACATPVADGMVVKTRSPLALDAQKGTMEFLLINHPLDCPICDQGGECELQDLAMGYGGDVSRYTERKRVVRDKNIGPLIATDLTRCIHCTRCVRFGEEIAGLPELGVTGRGEHMEIGTYVERSLVSELSGNVIDLCPVGALTAKPSRYTYRPWELIQKPAVSPHDCVGSNLFLHVRGGEVMRVVPRENDAVNETWIADRDRFSYQAIHSADRLERPMLKRNGRWEAVDWDVAIEAVADGLRATLEGPGPEGLGALGSSSATLEELFALQKLMRGLGSENVDHRLRQADFRDQALAPVMPWLGQDIAALEDADAILLVGSYVRKDQPMIAHRLRKAALAGAKIALINPRRFDFQFPVFEQLAARPGAMVGELAAAYAAALELVGSPPPAALKEVIGRIPVREGHRRIAMALRDGERAGVLLGAIAESDPDLALLRALASELADVTGARFGYLPSGANAAGAWLAGAVPHRLPGGASAERTGRNAREMLEAGCDAYLLLGVEPEHEAFDPGAAVARLRQARFVAALTPFRGPGLLDYADCLLPVGSFAETAGTFVNAEGRWQSFQGAVAPLAGARPAWKVLRVLAEALGVEGFAYTTVDELRQELQAACREIELDNRLVFEQLPRVTDYDGDLVRSGHVAIYATDALTRRARALQETADARVVAAQVNPAQAARLGLDRHARVRVLQGGSDTVLSLVLDEQVPEGCVWIPFGTSATAGLGPAVGAVKLEGL